MEHTWVVKRIRKVSGGQEDCKRGLLKRIFATVGVVKRIVTQDFLVNTKNQEKKTREKVKRKNKEEG